MSTIQIFWIGLFTCCIIGSIAQAWGRRGTTIIHQCDCPPPPPEPHTIHAARDAAVTTLYKDLSA